MTTPAASDQRRWLVTFWVVLAILAAASVACFALFLMPRHGLLDLFSFTDGQRERVAIPDRAVNAVRAGMAAAAALFAILAVALVVLRRRTLRVFEAVGRDVAKTVGLMRGTWSAWRSDTRTLGAVALLGSLGLGIALRLSMLTLSMGQDESITIGYFAARGVPDVVSDYVVPNNHIFHTILVHFSMLLFGTTEATVRAPALVGGVLVIPMAAWLAYRLFDGTTSLITALLVAAAPVLVEYSATARGYSLLTFFVLLAFIAASYDREKPSLASAAVFVAASVLGFYTVSVMLFPFVALLLFLGWTGLESGSGWRALRRTAALAATVAVSVAVLFLPVMARCSMRAECSGRYYAKLSWPQFVQENAQAWFDTLSGWLGGVPLAVGAAALAAGLLAGMMLGARRTIARRLITSFVVTIALISVIQRVAPPARTWSFLTPFVFMLAACGLVQLGRRAGRTAGALVTTGLLAILPVYWTARQVSDPAAGRLTDAPGVADGNQYREISRYIVSHAAPGDVAVTQAFTGIAWPARFYLLKAGLSPCAVHQYEPHLPLNQIAAYPTMLVFSQRERNRSPAADIAAEFGVEPDEIGAAFDAPRLEAEFGKFVAYRLVRKQPPASGARGICGIATPFG